MSAKGKKPVVPRLRFPEFRDAGEWEVQKIRQNLSESRVKGSKGDVAKKLTVKLWRNGVFEKQEALKGSANTQYYRRKAGQFIYSKLDFLNQAFGIVPDRLDNYESIRTGKEHHLQPGAHEHAAARREGFGVSHPSRRFTAE